MAEASNTTTSPAVGDSAGIARRRLLGAVAAAPVIAATASVAAAEQSDAELLAAWRGFQQVHYDFDAACERLPDGGTNEDHAPFWRRMNEFQEKIETLSAHSMAGVAVKLRLLFAEQNPMIDAQRSAIHGAPLSPELAADMDENEQMLWRLIGDVERLAAGAVA